MTTILRLAFSLLNVISLRLENVNYIYGGTLDEKPELRKGKIVLI